MKRFISALLVLSLAASVLTLSACGNSSEQEESSKPVSRQSSTVSQVQQPSAKPSEEEVEVSIAENKPKITETQLTELSSKLTDNQSIPEFTCTSEKLNASEIAKDKKMYLISENSQSSFHSMVESNFKKTAKRIGFGETTVAETDGSISALNDGLNDAVKKKSDIVILSGDINKNAISSYIETAQANGIEVFSSGSKSVGEKDHFTDYTVPINYAFAGELMADWGIVKTGGKINALCVSCTDSELSASIFKGFKAEFEKYVSSSEGSCTTVNANSIEIGNGLANKIKSAVSSDTKINYIFVFDDAAINDAISAVVQSGQDIKIVATGGRSEDMDLAESGSIEMLVAHSYEWTAYAILDYALRFFGGKSLPAVQDVPFRILTKDIIEKAKKDSKDDFDSFHEICFGGAFVDGYNNLWSI